MEVVVDPIGPTAWIVEVVVKGASVVGGTGGIVEGDAPAVVEVVVVNRVVLVTAVELVVGTVVVVVTVAVVEVVVESASTVIEAVAQG